MEYLLHLAILTCLTTMLVHSLNISAGYTGEISLAQAGFYGIGAYTATLLATQLNASIMISIPIAMLLCGAIAFAVAIVAVRTVEDYFIICTLGIQSILFAIFNNWIHVTGGPLGISNIPSIHLMNINIQDKKIFLIFTILIMLIIYIIIRNISLSGFGKTLIAIGEDEIYAQSIGKNVYLLKSISFTQTAMFSAVPGVLYAHYISYVDPTSFTLNQSIYILAIVVLGGFRNLNGGILASIFMVFFPEFLRFLGMPNNIAANVRQMLYGLILVLIMIKGKNHKRLLIKFKKNLFKS